MQFEKHSHQQTKDDCESRTKVQKDFNEKTLTETNNKLTSLQQHYKLLQTQHDDSNNECAKSKAHQLEEINGLQKKLKSLETQNAQALKEKDKELELLKVMFVDYYDYKTQTEVFSYIFLNFNCT